MPLCDRTIEELLEEGELIIDPRGEDAIQPAGIDLRLGREFYAPCPLRTIAPHRLTGREFELIEDPLDQHGELLLRPGAFILGTTMERVTLPPDIQGRLDLRSTYARCGVFMHLAAGNIEPGFSGNIEPGFSGHITLEIANISGVPVSLKPGERVVQLVLSRLNARPRKSYAEKGGRYQHQEHCTPPR